MQIRRENPFLGLKPYREEDQLYGRDKDLFLMTDRIFCARTTLLFAGSGVGKTSFINAKIIPDLKSQYSSIIYHNQWAIGHPLENLLQSIAEHLPAANLSPAVEVAAATGSPNAAAVKPPSFFVNNQLASSLKQFINEAGSEDTNRCLLILDQFEEVFQDHHGKRYFEGFIKQLAELINYKNCNVRVLFSMREEFLGELSVFDNKIPDLFSNYYRLKCPNKQEAKNIIESTCRFVDMPVQADQLTNLVRELTWILRAEPTGKQDENGNEESQESDIVAPPYLQIACRRLWDRQFNSANGAPVAATGETQEEKFLSDYEHGDAREMLKSFCEEILDGFNKRDRALLAEAFNYLVTKKGAKMAYALSSLAEHMGVKEQRLQSVLHRLSDPNSRILRESKGADDVIWYELYHDMYGKIIDEWRRAYREQQKKESNRRLVAAAAVIIVIALVTVLIWQWSDRRQKLANTIARADLSNQVSYLSSKQAFDDLQNTLFSHKKGRELWGEAWNRRATSAETAEDGQLAFLSLLKAAEIYPPKREDSKLLSEINSYLSSDEYGALLKSYRLEIGVTTSPAFKPILVANGKMLLTVGKDREVFFWDTETYIKRKSVQLAVDAPNQTNFYSSGPPPFLQHAENPVSETQVQAATENLIGGLDNNKFCIWDVSTGQKLWQSDLKSGPKNQRPKSISIAQTYDYYQSTVKQSDEQSPFSFSANGDYFTTWDGLNSFLYKLSNGKASPILEDLMPSVTRLQFSPDGHTVALVFKDGTAQLRNLETNESRSLALDGKSTRSIIFSPDGSRFLADMGFMKPTQVWDTASGSKIQDASVPMGDQFFCQDNKTIASILPMDQFNATIIGIRFWDIKTHSVKIRSIKLDERTGYFTNPNGKSLLTIGASGNAQLWDLTPPEASANNLITDSAQIQQSAISDDGQVIVNVNNNQKLSVWNANDLTRRGEEFSLPPTTNLVRELIVSKSGKYVCLKTNLNNFSVRRLGDKNEIIQGTFEDPSATAASFSPDEEAFAVANQRGSIALWRQLDTTPIFKVISLTKPSSPDPVSAITLVRKLVFSADGKYLAAIGSDYSPDVKVFDLANLANSTTMTLPTEGFTSTIAFGRNGMMIGTIQNDDKVVLIWDLAKGQSRKLRHDSSVTAVALSNDTTKALTSTSNGKLQLWDTASGKQLANGPCGTRIKSLTMSDDNQTVVAVSDKWVHIHSIKGALLSYFNGHEIADPLSLRILDRSGKICRSLFPHIQDSLRVDLFDFSSVPTATGPVGDAARLFSDWRNKLALDFDQSGLVTPIRPH